MTEHNLEMHEPENQLVISFELICLLKWILENEDVKIKKIISKALLSGLTQELNKKHVNKDLMLDDIQRVLLEFFDMMEVLLVECISEQAVKKALENNLMPAIEQIDSSVCDDATVRFSVEKATSKLEASTHTTKETPEVNQSSEQKKTSNTNEEAKKLLMEELLKRWKPHKKNILN